MWFFAGIALFLRYDMEKWKYVTHILGQLYKNSKQIL